MAQTQSTLTFQTWTGALSLMLGLVAAPAVHANTLHIKQAEHADWGRSIRAPIVTHMQRPTLYAALDPAQRVFQSPSRSAPVVVTPSSRVASAAPEPVNVPAPVAAPVAAPIPVPAPVLAPVPLAKPEPVSAPVPVAEPISVPVPLITPITENASPTQSAPAPQSEPAQVVVPAQVSVPIIEVAAPPEPEPAPAEAWAVELSDSTVRLSLKRWAQNAGWQLVWDANRDLVIDAQVTFYGSFEQALASMMHALVDSEFPLQARVNTEAKIVRIQRLASSQAR